MIIICYGLFCMVVQLYSDRVEKYQLYDIYAQQYLLQVTNFSISSILL